MRPDIRHLASAAGLVLMAIAPAAFAQSMANPIVVEGGMPTIRVSYADLDLGSESGRAALNERIDTAAYRVCWQAYPPSALDPHNRALCRRMTRQDATRQVDAQRALRADAASPEVVLSVRRPDGR